MEDIFKLFIGRLSLPAQTTIVHDAKRLQTKRFLSLSKKGLKLKTLMSTDII